MPFATRINQPLNHENCLDRIRDAVELCSIKQDPVLKLGGGTLSLYENKARKSFENFMGSGFCGTPEFYQPPYWETAVQIRSVGNFTIDGENATLMMQGFTQPFKVVECDHFTLRNITIDWERPTYSIATVHYCEGNHVFATVWDEFPISDDIPVHIIGEYDKNMLATPNEFIALSARRIANQDIVIETDKSVSIRCGQILVIRHTICCFSPFEALNCTNIKLENVTIHAAPGIGILLRGCSNMELDRVRIVPRPNSQKLMSSAHDAVMVTGGKNTLLYKDCEFVGMGDDAIGTGGAPRFHVIDIPSSNTMHALFPDINDTHNTPHALPPEPGSIMELIRIGEGVVAELEVLSCHFDDQTGLLRITFNSDIPVSIRKSDMIMERDRHCSCRVMNCVFGPNRSRGTMVGRAFDVVVENCVFYHVGGSGAFIYKSLRGSRVGPVVYRNNTFIHCGHGVANMGATAIYTEDHWYEMPDDLDGTNRTNNDITIEGNYFKGLKGPAIRLASADRCIVSNNHFDNPFPVLVLENCSNILLAGNTFSHSEAEKWYDVDDLCDRESIQSEMSFCAESTFI